MRILLLGEYSRLHNSLKEGLLALGHEVVLVGNGDGFKQYPTDYSIEAKFLKSKFINPFRQVFSRIFSYDLAYIEQGFRFWFLLPKLKNFDVIQLINEKSIHTHPIFEIFLLKKLFRKNNKVFILSSGVDYLNLKFMLENKQLKTLMKPYFDNPELYPLYKYVFEYQTKSHYKLHLFLYQKCVGYIASDFDYVLPMQTDKKFLGLIPNPINISKLKIENLHIEDKTILFLGINQWNKIQKGIPFFEDALEILKQKYKDTIKIIVAQNLPYKTYIDYYNQAHILLDQVFAYDQGYNALEAMAKGKVVVTGAEPEFETHYNLKERVAVNAKPDVNYLVDALSFLIENPTEIYKTSNNAKEFVQKFHNHIDVAKLYLKCWEKV